MACRVAMECEPSLNPILRIRAVGQGEDARFDEPPQEFLVTGSRGQEMGEGGVQRSRPGVADHQPVFGVEQAEAAGKDLDSLFEAQVRLLGGGAGRVRFALRNRERPFRLVARRQVAEHQRRELAAAAVMPTVHVEFDRHVGAV